MRKLLVLLVLIVSYPVLGQDDYGIGLSNYAPTKTVHHNPANLLDSKVYLDVHLIGAGMFINNNFLYQQGAKFSFLNNIILGQSWPDFSYNFSDGLKQGFQDTDLQLLSGAFQYKEHGFGLGVRMRTYFDFRRIPNTLAKLMESGPANFSDYYNQVLDANNSSMNQMAYLEIYGNYANAAYHFDHDLLIFGGTLKYLMGVTGASIKIDDLEYNLLNESDINFFKYKGTVATSYPEDDSFSSGSGFGADFGVVYKKMLNNVTYYNPFSKQAACEGYDYKFKLGASIVDFGFIKFKKNARRVDVETDVTSTNLTGGEFSFDGWTDFASNEFSQTSTATDFIMWTPTALNLQADYNFENYFFAGAQYTHGFFRRIGMGVMRPHVLTLQGRYERKWFEASLSGSMYNFNDFRTGLMLRFGYLTLGTDNLGSMLGLWDFYGTDLYFNLRFFLTQKPGCKRKHKKSRRNETRCVKN